MEVVNPVAEEDARLVGELYPSLRRFAAVVSPWDLDPDDVLHGALVAVLRGRRLHVADDPGAYARRAIVNHVRSEVRRRGAMRRAVVRLRGSAVAGVDPVYPSDLAVLLGLRPLERAVLFLHDIEGFSFGEVAEMVGVAVGTARVMASRARRRLRGVFAEEAAR